LIPGTTTGASFDRGRVFRTCGQGKKKDVRKLKEDEESKEDEGSTKSKEDEGSTNVRKMKE
jgi:hypothetical protein